MATAINDVLKWAKQQLQASDTAALDAEILLAHLLKMNRAQLYIHSNQIVDAQLSKSFEQLINRRLIGEPVAYIVGYQEFWSLSFKVTPDTLIPRPETECLVECALAKLPVDKGCKIVDLGTGSGAVALAIASERPHWTIMATDKMPAALAIAQENAQRLQISNVNFKQSNWCEALGDEKFDAIISNPPYINANDQYWRANINLFEPITALLADDAGLADLHIIIQQASQHLKPDGWLMLEHGYDQSNIIQQMLVQYGYRIIETKRDLANIERVVVAKIH